MSTPRAAAPLIAHIVYSFKVGGLENGIVNLLNRLPLQRYRHVIVAMTEADPGFCRRIHRDDVQVIALHKPPGQGYRLFPKMHATLRALAPAVVHTRNLAALEMTVPAWWAGARARIHGEHGRDVDDPDGRSYKRRLQRRLYRPFVTQYVALSRDLASYLERGVGVPAGRIETLCNGVDTQRFTPARARPEGMPFDAGDWVIGTVGRLQAIKDQAGLVRAFARMAELDPQGAARCRLAIVGEGAQRGEIEAVARSLGVAARLWLPGERGDMPQVMAGFDCFTLPSLGEGISNTVLEAMACGLPVVATAVGGNPELVEDGATGALVPPADPEALALALLAYARAPQRAAAHGVAARARVEAQFSLDAMVARYDALYQRAMSDAQ